MKATRPGKWKPKVLYLNAVGEEKVPKTLSTVVVLPVPLGCQFMDSIKSSKQAAQGNFTHTKQVYVPGGPGM